MVPTDDEFFIDDEEDEFDVDDHHVVWTNAEDTNYPVWFCITHKKHYYKDCV